MGGMNPYDAPKTETPTDKPVPAEVAHKQPALQRALAVAVPACAGAGVMAGVDSSIAGNWLAATLSFAMSGAMLALAWRWTK